MKVRILESARRDLRAGYNFYERQETGVGDYFLNLVFADIDSLALYGGIHPRRSGFHWMLASKFPYAIYYRIEKEEVVVPVLLAHRFEFPRLVVRGADSSIWFVTERVGKFEAVDTMDRVEVHVTPEQVVTTRITPYARGPSDWGIAGRWFGDPRPEAEAISAEIGKKLSGSIDSASK